MLKQSSHNFYFKYTITLTELSEYHLKLDWKIREMGQKRLSFNLGRQLLKSFLPYSVIIQNVMIQLEQKHTDEGNQTSSYVDLSP